MHLIAPLFFLRFNFPNSVALFSLCCRRAPRGDAARQQEQGERVVAALFGVLGGAGRHAQMRLDHGAGGLDLGVTGRRRDDSQGPRRGQAGRRHHRGAVLVPYQRQPYHIPGRSSGRSRDTRFLASSDANFGQFCFTRRACQDGVVSLSGARRCRARRARG